MADSDAVPDLVIRPPSSPRAMLPVLVEPKADRRMGFILAGAIAALLLFAVGMIAFHNTIASMLPAEWRAILNFDSSAIAPPLHDRTSSS